MFPVDFGCFHLFYPITKLLKIFAWNSDTLLRIDYISTCVIRFKCTLLLEDIISWHVWRFFMAHSVYNVYVLSLAMSSLLSRLSTYGLHLTVADACRPIVVIFPASHVLRVHITLWCKFTTITCTVGVVGYSFSQIRPSLHLHKLLISCELAVHKWIKNFIYLACNFQHFRCCIFGPT